MADELSNADLRKLKARAQSLKPVAFLGKGGVSTEFLQNLESALAQHELVKVKLTDFKEERKILAPQLAEKTGSQLITLLGHVVVLYRKRPSPPAS